MECKMNWMDPVWREWLLTWPLLLFFFAIGQELRKELVGTSEKKHFVVPVMAALGGMLAPAGLYLLFAAMSGGQASAWGVPMATDLPLVLIALAFFNARIQKQLRVFLITLAIADDIGSILVLGVLGSAHGGIHPTILGAILGFAWGARWHSHMQKIANFIIMPIFLLAAFSVDFDISLNTFKEPLVWNLILSRVIGKPAGVIVGALIGYWVLRIGKENISRLHLKDLWLAGALTTLGLSVSVVFISIVLPDTSEQALAMTATVATIVIACARIAVLRLTTYK
jgi:NhaA family Na+:H+ antiporter